MNTLIESIESTHEALLERAVQLQALLNVLPSDRPDERKKSVAALRALIREVESLLTRCRFDEQDLFASGLDFPLVVRERQRADQEELQVLLEIVDAESWHLRGAPPIGFLCLLRSLALRIRQHVEHENEALAPVTHAEAVC